MQASATARATLSRWYWAVPYLAVTVLALSMLAVVWLLQERETEVEREDWGLTWNAALETGGVLVSKKIKLVLDVSAIKQA